MLGDNSMLLMLKESFTLIILAFCSVLNITFMIERWWAIRRAQGSGDAILAHVHKLLEERLKLERYLGVLGTLGNVAPFIGLFGTVVGIIKAFQDLALAGGGGPAVVARGIAEALVATAAGLVVAIPAVIIYNYFTRKVKSLSGGMEVASTRLLVMLGSK